MHPTLRYFLLFYLRVYLRHKDREKKHVSKKVKSITLVRKTKRYRYACAQHFTR